MKTIILDNYDSFTYNLYQYIAELGGNPIVFRNDEISIKEIEKMKPSHIVISPGPGTPEKKKDFGVCGDVIRLLGKKIPILGVCLGHQGIANVFKGRIIQAPSIMHGKTSQVSLLESVLFKGIPKKVQVMRYHSLVVDPKSFPKDLKVTAMEEEEGVIMGLEHTKYPIYGIQFHPESIGTPDGMKMLKNFLRTKVQ